ncbi:MAG: STAS domain-containing protein [Candidatus Hydrogenedentota bacterium]
MIINVSDEDNAIIVYIKGAINSHNINILEDKIRELISHKKYNIILDCSDVQSIDSTGLEILMQAAKNVRLFRGNLVILTTNEDIREIFKITRIDKEIKVHTSQKQALQEFRQD